MEHSPPPVQKKVAKRSSNACTRCRRQKTRCSGLQPCDGCARRNLRCVFDDRDNKVLVTQGHLSALHDKIAQLERSAGSSSSPDAHQLTEGQQQQQQSPVSEQQGHRGQDEALSALPAKSSQPARNPVNLEQSSSSGQGPTVQPPAETSSGPSSEPGTADIVNPLAATTAPTFVSAANGRTFYLGTSSTWSFSGKILQMTHFHLFKTQLPPSAILFDECAYDLGWDGFRTRPAPDDALVIPSYDYTIFLINAVKFHGGQLFHLFDDEHFKQQLDQFYASPVSSRVEQAGLWYTHFLLILALGKAFVRSRAVDRKPAGAEYFVRALQGLPDLIALCRDAVLSTEILCCIALYLQSIDHRNSAHVHIGQAMRVALGYGMHTAMPINELGEAHVQRCRKAWWTVYVLDRQMTSLMGLPQSIRDTDIDCQLPVFSGSPHRATALGMQVRLSGIIAEINNNVYGSNGRLNKKFLISTKNALESAASLADELRETMPLKLDDPGSGVPRLAASLHLLYYQSIVLATRPLLFCCLKMKLDGNPSLKTLVTSRKIQRLLSVCTESCRQIIVILENLQVQGILETFITFDLDSLFVATIVLLIEPIVDPLPSETQTEWTRRAFRLLDDMIAGGNLLSAFRKSEAEKLSEMLLEINAMAATASAHHNNNGSAHAMGQALLSPPAGLTGEGSTRDLYSSRGPGVSGQFPPFLSPPEQEEQQDAAAAAAAFLGFADEWTTEQIIAVANSIESEDADWMDQTMAQNGMW